MAQGGFADAADFTVALVRAASEDRTALEAALLEGLASGPAEPWTGAEWQDLRDRVAGKDSQTCTT